jgi:DNA-3-methyladenine glycosylase II
MTKTVLYIVSAWLLCKLDLYRFQPAEGILRTVIDKENMDGFQKECRNAERFLGKVDPVMERLIKQYGPCRIHETKHTLFHSLASAVIGQQLSVKAADTIQRRVMKLTSRPLTPKSYLAVTEEAVQAAGLSRSKATYIRNIAIAILEDGLSKRKLQRLDDEQVKRELTAIKGIGSWTAEMYLMFGLKRLDVVSLGDMGLQRAACLLYNNGEPQEHLLARVSETWKPYRTIACWYLWEASD